MDFFAEIKRIIRVHCEVMGYPIAPSLKDDSDFNDLGFTIPASIRKQCAQGCDQPAVQNGLCLPCAKAKYGDDARGE